MNRENVFREGAARAARAREIGWAALVAEEMGLPVPVDPSPAPATPVSRPRVARAVARLKRDGERGVGDTVARLLAPLGGDVFKRWFERRFGGTCGCADRQDWLNARFPY